MSLFNDGGVVIDSREDDGWVDLDPATNVLMGLVGGGIALLTGIFFAWQISKIPLDESKKVTISLAEEIHRGAKAFLISEYKALAGFVVVAFALLAGIVAWQAAICFLVGAILSALSGWVGMQIATIANVRTTLACQGADGLNNGLRVAFKSGSVMALMVVGTGLLGLSIMYLIFESEDSDEVWQHLSGFAFGGSSIALFARVGGGIYTKAADVGADLVGKVEEELEEDSPDNPATIADNVGDNVGDVAGMGADLFESFVGSLIAAATIGNAEYTDNRAVAFPFYIAGFGAIASILGTFLVRAKKREHKQMTFASVEEEKAHRAKESEELLESLLWSIRYGIFGATFLVIGFTLVSVGICFGFGDEKEDGINYFVCVLLGLVAGNLIGYFTEYATSYTYWPTQSIARKSDTGPATVIIQGLGVGMLSTVAPVVIIVVTMLGAYYVADPHGFYGIAIAAVGMLSTLGVTLATDAFGPVADNAGGIAEMAPAEEIDDEVRETTDALDALGNTTAATGKGFAIGSAVLTALALLNAFADEAEIEGGALIDESQPPSVTNIRAFPSVTLLDPVILPGILLGALLPFVFAALTMLSVGKAAESIMWECRKQLNEKYFENKKLRPEECVAISTKASLREMVAPGTLAIFMPIIIGTMLGSGGLMGLLAGAISAGFLLAVMMANAGGAWDNAKKWVEKDNLGPGKGKKSDNHKAVVVGDTVGDPFKDTSGPALNILIKLMSIMSLVIADKLDAEAWEQWWISLIVIGILCFLAAAWYWFGSGLDLHDTAKIGERSARRKEEGMQVQLRAMAEKQRETDEQKEKADDSTRLAGSGLGASSSTAIGPDGSAANGDAAEDTHMEGPDLEV